MRDLKISYQVKGQNTFLVLEEPQDQPVIRYCVRMLENNHIPGLLPLFSQIIDEQEKLNYDITGKMKLGQLVQTTRITEENGRKILLNITKAMVSLEKYFLNPWSCVLSEEYVFVDSQCHVFLVYNPVPFHGQDAGQEVKNFFLAVVGLLSSNGVSQNQFNECLHFLIRPDFSLTAFQKLLEPETEKSGYEVPVQKDVEAPMEEVFQNQEPEKQKEPPRSFFLKKDDRKQEKASKSEKPAPELFGGSIPIPGGETMEPSPKERKREKAKKEKKEKTAKAEKGGFHLFGKKKPIKVELELEDYVMPADRQQAGQESAVSRDDQWSGTVNMEDDMGRTVMKSDEESDNAPYMLYQGRTCFISRLPFTIGKQDNCHLRMNNPTVSRHHATITKEEGIYFITDENSMNKTYVNGQVIPPYSPIPLSDGDRIVCSNQEIIFKKG